MIIYVIKRKLIIETINIYIVNESTPYLNIERFTCTVVS